jgi:hypothetical protein
MNHNSSGPLPTEKAFDFPTEAAVHREQRRHARRPSGATIAVQPVDRTGRSCGHLLVGTCVDISESGIRLELLRPTDAEFLELEPVIDPTSDIPRVVMQVLHCQLIHGWYIYAGQFVDLENAGAA